MESGAFTGFSQAKAATVYGVATALGGGWPEWQDDDFREVPLGESRLSGRAVLRREMVVIVDTEGPDVDPDLRESARLLGYVHVATGDTMIACWEAKYHYWYIRPQQADAGIVTARLYVPEPDGAEALGSLPGGNRHRDRVHPRADARRGPLRVAIFDYGAGNLRSAVRALEQMPPAFSAKKIDGVRAYELARASQ